MPKATFPHPSPIPAKISGVPLTVNAGVCGERTIQVTNHEIIFLKYSNVRDHGNSTSRTDRWTDRWTVDLSCSNTALCVASVVLVITVSMLELMAVGVKVQFMSIKVNDVKSNLQHGSGTLAVSVTLWPFTVTT